MLNVLMFYIFLLGAIVGSFLNVVALRWGTKMSSVSGRSVCFHCNKTLKWFEVVPIMSFIFLRGKCRSCKTRLSARYLVVEILTGLVFVGAFIRQYDLWPIYGVMTNGLTYSILFFFYYVVIFSILIIIVLYDIRHKIIPDELVYTFISLSVAKLFLFIYLTGFPISISNIFNLISPLALSLPFAALWYFSNGRWIGFGDVKLLFGIGALLGFVCGLSAVVLAFWLGTLWVFINWFYGVFFKHNNLGWHSELPMAPFLVLAVFLVFIWHFDFFSLNLLLQ
jgi:leader peptidase (prepilin peptidase)/N-methyltransferase